MDGGWTDRIFPVLTCPLVIIMGIACLSNLSSEESYSLGVREGRRVPGSPQLKREIPELWPYKFLDHHGFSAPFSSRSPLFCEWCVYSVLYIMYVACMCAVCTMCCMFCMWSVCRVVCVYSVCCVAQRVMYIFVIVCAVVYV